MSRAPLILASTSPRRAALLAEAGIAFEPLDPGVKDGDEALLADRWRARGLSPGDVARRLAVTKALAAAARRRSGLILAADTVVTLEGRVLGKPRDAAHAREMIELLAGTTHEVITGVALLDLDTGKLEAETETSRVSVRKVDAATLERFLASGTWAGKAGGYGVQDKECEPLVSAVEGSTTNVIGLPVERVRALLARVAVGLAVLALAGCPDRTVVPPPGPVPVVPHQHGPDDGHDHDHENEPVKKKNGTPEIDDGIPNRGLKEIQITVGGVPVTVELALTDAERQLGLMHRDSMPEDRGMLFIYPERKKDFHNFWMHNTKIGLSLAYLRDDGTIVNIEDMEPLDERTPHPSKERIRLGLELNKGWFKVHGVGPGAPVTGITPEILSKAE